MPLAVNKYESDSHYNMSQSNTFQQDVVQQHKHKTRSQHQPYRKQHMPR